MSNSSPVTPNLGKSMSSRLLTMKFMQRAAASSSPGSETLSPDVPSAKRQKLSSTPESTRTLSSDHQAIQAALKAEEEKVLQAVNRRAAEAGETKWSLSYSDQGEGIKKSGGLQVVHVGYSSIDASGSKNRGRMKFGNFISSPTKQSDGVTNPDFSSTNEASEAESEEYNDDGDLVREREVVHPSSEEMIDYSKAGQKAENGRNIPDVDQSSKKKSKGVKLSSLTSISGGKPHKAKSSHKNSGGISEVVCYKCGQKGHKQSECYSKSSNQKRKIGFNYHVAAKKSRVTLNR